MRAALALAQRSLGTTWPNPAVGCVLARDGIVVGRGRTAPGGRPHAETEALAAAGGRARGATAYVSLEPCAHHGQTPPCAEALIGAGVARVVFAMQDPDPRVNGGGGAMLAKAGIAVASGVCANEAAELNAGFLLRMREGRPLVTLKVATTLDGRIAAVGGRSQWITGATARAAAHLLRARHDAVLVGATTLAADDPLLTVRLPGLPERPPLRIVVAGRAMVAAGRRLFASLDEGPVWLVLAAGNAPPRDLPAGIEIVSVPGGPMGRPDPAAMLAEFGRRGLTRILVEGGAKMAGALVRAGLVDRIAWFRAASLMGGDGVPALDPLGVGDPAAAPRWRRLDQRPVGTDVMETYAALR
ncbi:MAG: bifunctional diaminohydroxyphosphoribosylaminopyrimidine deaminase/5-amino-6-(5-phosphoribosylamino)uracil reductase RibD [Rhodospirillaceae bacterium]|nr:bifunctional diaminohydroxyphosphoribosylaminopyrimidine deaminase/5-amino-6-(5-phosphoribosylamino)uracil reductase RibD [Rhodospirillaceae bacterium]